MDYDSDSVFEHNRTGRDPEVRNLFRHGKVTERIVDLTQVCVRVQYLDKDGLISKPLPVKQKGSRTTGSFYCPKVGDDVCVTMLPNGSEDGFVDGSFYNTGNPPPTVDPDCHHTTFADGTIIEYVEALPATVGRAGRAGQLRVKSAQPINITSGAVMVIAPSVTIQAPSITLQGNVHITGTLTVDDNVSFGKGGSIATHLTNNDGQGNGS